MKQIQIHIFPNGEIKAETYGMTGKTCLQYISEIERLTDAVATDSEYTNDGKRTDNLLETVGEQEVTV
ncbi:MAG: DUF2997 domain-containing protein [Candidatus Fimenecus sp.]